MGKKKENTVQPNHLMVPPNDLEAEQAILGGVLLNNDAMNQIMDILKPEDFYREAHATIFEKMVNLYNRDEPIDLITLSNELGKKDYLERVGGNAYLAALVQAITTSAGIVYHANIVRNLSVRRKLINQCSSITSLCYSDDGNTEDLLEMAEQSIFDIAEGQVREGFQSLKQVINGNFKKIEARQEHPGYVTGVPTGFDDFDRLTSGLQPSDLIIIAARPSMGKTALALNIGYNAAKITRKAVALFSLEMSRQQLGFRMLGFDSGISSKRLMTGNLGEQDFDRLRNSANRLSDLPIFIDDSSGIGVLEMKAKCRRLKKRNDIAMVIVDYLQLIQGRHSAESRQLEMSEVSRSLKALAKDLNVPVVALSQLNRKVEDRTSKVPQLADLRESGAIEQDADVIAFIYREEVYNPRSIEKQNIAEIIIGKQRNGPTGTFKLTFQKELTRFQNYIAEEVPM